MTSDELFAQLRADHGLYAWANGSFKAAGLDLAAFLEKYPDQTRQVEGLVRAWNMLTADGHDFGTAVILILNELDREAKSHANSNK